MRIRIAHSLEELAHHQTAWDALADARGLPLLQYAWFLSAERHLAEPGSVRVVLVLDRNDSLIAVCALELRRDAAVRECYQLLGMARLYEPSGLLYRDPAGRNALLRALAGLDRPVVLARLWPDEFMEGFESRRVRLSRHALMLGKYAAPSQYLELTGDYAQYIEALPAQRRYDLRRAYRRAEAAGTLHCDITLPTAADIDAVLDTALAVEARSWKGRRGCALLAQPDLHGFFSTLLRAQAVAQCVLVALLYSDTQPIAAQICLLGQRRLWLLKIGYDEQYAKLSPGLILMNEVIRYTYGQGFAGIEFLGSAEDWVDAWRPALRQYPLLALYPYTPRSLVRLGADLAGLLRRRLPRAAAG